MHMDYWVRMFLDVSRIVCSMLSRRYFWLGSTRVLAGDCHSVAIHLWFHSDSTPSIQWIFSSCRNSIYVEIFCYLNHCSGQLWIWNHHLPVRSQFFPTFCLSVFQFFPPVFPAVFQAKKQWRRRCHPKVIATRQCRVTHPTPRVMARWVRPRVCPPQAMGTSNFQAWTVNLRGRVVEVQRN